MSAIVTRRMTGFSGRGAVRRATRCPQGRVLAHGGDRLPSADGLSPAKARIALMLELMR